MASLIGSGVMDRYPHIRIAVLEAGHGWLPYWMTRLDEHAHSVASALPELKHPPSWYVQSGRYFQSIELSEGVPLTNTVLDLIGDDVLMFASDYPHGESWFPLAVDAFMDWHLEEPRRSRLLWENATRFYERAELS